MVTTCQVVNNRMSANLWHGTRELKIKNNIILSSQFTKLHSIRNANLKGLMKISDAKRGKKTTHTAHSSWEEAYVLEEECWDLRIRIHICATIVFTAGPTANQREQNLLFVRLGKFPRLHTTGNTASVPGGLGGVPHLANSSGRPLSSSS
jgi:hypothetical protein